MVHLFASQRRTYDIQNLTDGISVLGSQEATSGAKLLRLGQGRPAILGLRAAEREAQTEAELDLAGPLRTLSRAKHIVHIPYRLFCARQVEIASGHA